jgi:hypothetical protein
LPSARVPAIEGSEARQPPQIIVQTPSRSTEITPARVAAEARPFARDVGAGSGILSKMRRMLFLMMLAGCGAPHSEGAATSGPETWLVFDVALPTASSERSTDYILPFEQSARARGCSTERLGSSAPIVGGGELRLVGGIRASCDDGTIALAAVSNDRVRVACVRPSTRERCEDLLRKISEADR